jgi:hypothetical protein
MNESCVHFIIRQIGNYVQAERRAELVQAMLRRRHKTR